MKNNTIDAVLVTYNPDKDLLKSCINSLSFQVRKIWIINNYSIDFNVEDELFDDFNNIEVISLGENKGIAYAQNHGIKKSLYCQAKFILLSDQDTIYPENFVQKILPAFVAKNNPVAAIAPLFHDAVGNKKNDVFILLSKFGYSIIFPDKGHYEINHAIASGLILNSEYLFDIGLMNTDLFIDWVDFEWCWRAISKGYCIIGNANVVIKHNLGDAQVHVAEKSMTVRSSLRHYYIVRNAFYLARHSPSLNFLHRLNLFYWGVCHVAAYSILAKPRLENIKLTFLGFYHGVTRRLGRLD